VWEAWSDVTLIILTAAAVTSLILSFYHPSSSHAVDETGQLHSHQNTFFAFDQTKSSNSGNFFSGPILNPTTTQGAEGKIMIPVIINVLVFFQLSFLVRQVW